jgi:hypothetical protein
VGIETVVLAAASPVQVALVAVGVALLVFTSVDLWRNHAYSTSDRVGWQLVIGGLSLGPLVGLDDGWFLGFPLGASAYLLLAKHGPVRRRSTTARRRSTTEATTGADRPTIVGGTDR